MKKIEFDYEENVEYKTRVNKVRAILINKQGNILLVKYAGLYMLPGGRIDEGETELQALKREIREETGIEISIDNIEPYLEIEAYNKNFYTRVENREINRITNTKFYIVNTDQEISDENRNLTEYEKLIDEIFETLTNKGALVEKLAEMYSEPIESLMDDCGDEKNATMWDATF